MKMIDIEIKKLICYALEKGLIEKTDVCFATNALLSLLGQDEYSDPEFEGAVNLAETLKNLCDYAVEKGFIEDGVVSRDLFDTALMGALTPRPSEVIRQFRELYEENPEKATDYFYALCRNSNYIRTDRVARDLKWVADTEYGELDITVNLSKPEKDPKAIAAAKLMKQSGYPKCLLCRENEGYRGRINHPARQNHRMIPTSLDGESWYLQYSPYVYYNEHCIVLKDSHTPMVIDRSTFYKLTEFTERFPHYFVGSNADLPIVGGSILTHEHFQGGRYTFAMAKAPEEERFTVEGFGEVSCATVKWPMSVIRLRSADRAKLCELADRILKKWRGYSDESVGILATTDGEPHNTVTPIARRRGPDFELDLVLRNNRTTEEYPLGIFHPHSELHHIKKENIGLIEVMGLAVLPARLKEEIKLVAEALVNGDDLEKNEKTAPHAAWAREVASRREITKENVEDILRAEIGIVFSKVLEHAGVYKRTPEGKEAFMRFCREI